MTLSDLTATLPAAQLRGDGTVEVTGVTHDSRRVEKGHVFVAIEGLRLKGTQFIRDAIDRGAAAVVSSLPPQAGFPSVPWVTVADTRAALSRLAANVSGCPTERMRVIGVTGTSGKTTTCYLASAVFASGGVPCGLMGTIEVRTKAGARKSSLTTPEATDIHATARAMFDEGTRLLVMEVSSHSLKLRRVDDVDFDVAVFTNLGHDHLDFHGDLDDYARSKAVLFSDLLRIGKGRGAVVNGMDRWTDRITGKYRGDVFRFSYEDRPGIDIAPTSWRATLEGIEGRIRTPWGAIEVSSPLLGRHNMLNIMAAAGVGLLSGIPPAKVEEGIAKLERVPGRMEKVPGADGRMVIVDYSHTPDSIRAALDSLADLTRGRIITVFGAGGDREKGKRPLMGKAAAQGSAACVATSDNPRSEDPDAIIAMIVEGLEEGGMRRGSSLEKGAYVVMPDRREAIRFAVAGSRPGDVVLVAGKGHEDYQIFRDKVIHFDDREVVAEALSDSGFALP